MVNSRVGLRETTSDDVSAYELIMKNKERLLDRDPLRSPVRFIFSHSALREGWDNPNVFQICTLKQSGSDVRKRQEVGRGLRLCVNENGERMDAGVLGKEVHTVNTLTVIAGESYDSFARGLQTEMAEAVADRSQAAAVDFLRPENARAGNVRLQVKEEKLAMPEFQALWSRINKKSVYTVDFDTDELVQKAIVALDDKLHVCQTYFRVETGAMETIRSQTELLCGTSFVKETSGRYKAGREANPQIKYDLIGKLVEETGLTRKALAAILTDIRPEVFSQFRENPEEFIVKAAVLINEEKAAAIVEHITYHALEERYDTDIFTAPTLRGRLGVNAMKAKRHLYDHVLYDSARERDFAADLEADPEVAVYVKLPAGFYIATPVGRYHPDWAIAFYEGTVKHICFVAETKGSVSSQQLRRMEESKIHCAREHFKAIAGENVVYDVVDSYQTLIEKVLR